MKIFQYTTIILLSLFLFLFNCDSDDDSTKPEEETFISLNSPYLICASRNPGGVGFDFEYKGKKGGADMMDSLSVADFEYDVKIRTIKAEKSDGSLGGMPFFQLSGEARAVNYSEVDTTCVGYTAFSNLTAANMKTFGYQSDDTSFDLSKLTPGSTGKPAMKDVQDEYKKLAIGERWKASAKNDIDGDEPIWIIQTKEGRQVKLIVPDFPADPAPTSTGYIELEWDFVE